MFYDRKKVLLHRCDSLLKMSHIQKQPLVGVLQNRCLEKFCNIHWKASVLNLFLIKLQAGPATLFKRDSNISVFQQTLHNL